MIILNAEEQSALQAKSGVKTIKVALGKKLTNKKDKKDESAVNGH